MFAPRSNTTHFYQGKGIIPPVGTCDKGAPGPRAGAQQNLKRLNFAVFACAIHLMQITSVAVINPKIYGNLLMNGAFKISGPETHKRQTGIIHSLASRIQLQKGFCSQRRLTFFSPLDFKLLAPQSNEQHFHCHSTVEAAMFARHSKMLSFLLPRCSTSRTTRPPTIRIQRPIKNVILRWKMGMMVDAATTAYIYPSQICGSVPFSRI
ncbi:hypothetical protein B0H19DRAFT_87545 [Mycena capillaripes]|nr:hypothetical protein B0H19DRAFT_87545 [Mycena capillaripes]